MMKIFVNKNDEVVSVAEQIVTSPDVELVLVVPRFSKLAESAANFLLLKREAEAVGKVILVESVDDHVISLAKASHVDALNPFFEQAAHRREVTDIIRTKRPRAEREEEEMEEHPKPYRKPVHEEDRRAEAPVSPPRQKRSGFKKFVYFTLLLLILGGGGGYAGLYVLPQADVALLSKKAAWEYGGEVVVDKAGSQVTGQVFSKQQNQSFSFPASGKRNVERKAKGVITIYNAYSSSPQYLVATTRFMAPDGRIYRLDKGVTVPGAKVSGGTIEPSSIDAEVSADKIGADYNTGPIARLSIPGFQGTPRYEGFYGELKNGASGGVVGEVLFPTEDDITAAKDSARSAMQKSIETFLLAQIDAEFRVVPGATKFEVVKENVVEEVAADGKFSVFLDAKTEMMAFREDDMVRFLEAKAQQELGKEYKVESYELSFQNAAVDFVNQTMRVPVQFKGAFAHAIDTENFKSLAAGKAEEDLKTIIFGIPGVQSATVNLWPFWVSKVPKDTEKISVTVE